MHNEVKIYGSWLGKILEAGPEQSIVRFLEGPLIGKEWCVSARDLLIANSTEGTTMTETETISMLVEKYNSMVLTAVDLGLKEFKVVKTFRDKATSVRRCDALHEAIQKSKSNGGEEEAEVKKKSKGNAKKQERQGALVDTAKIHDIVENPKRGKAKERFALYREGMLVSTYKEKVGNPTLAAACLRWDVKHGFIKLTV